VKNVCYNLGEIFVSFVALFLGFYSFSDSKRKSYIAKQVITFNGLERNKLRCLTLRRAVSLFILAYLQL